MLISQTIANSSYKCRIIMRFVNGTVFIVQYVKPFVNDSKTLNGIEALPPFYCFLTLLAYMLVSHTLRLKIPLYYVRTRCNKINGVLCKLRKWNIHVRLPGNATMEIMGIIEVGWLHVQVYFQFVFPYLRRPSVFASA